jgi:hypothetical protein
MVRRIVVLAWLAVTACHFNDRQFNDRACNTDQDCPRPDQACLSSVCTQRPCSTSNDCGGGYAYQCTPNGCAAQECSSASECGTGFTCPAGFCQASFNVASAAAATNTSITVTFDAPPDAASATNVSNYAVSGLTVSGTPTLAGNTVTLTTSSQMATSYTVTVTGVTRAADQAPLTAATATFTGRTAFDVTSASAASSISVAITFDAPPEMTSATTLANYMVMGLTLSGTPTVSGSTVTITTSPQAVATYGVMVMGVRRASDGEPLTVSSATFTGRIDFNVASAAATSSSTITVTFDAPPSATAATTLSNYTVSGLVLSGAPTLSGNIVTIATSTQAAQTYTVTVSTNITRAADGEPLTIRTANFMGRTPFDVVSAKSTGSGTMTVTFSDPPTLTEAMMLANYTVPGLTLGGTPAVVGNTVTLVTSPQTGGASYTITVSGVTRMSDTEILSNASATFTGTPSFNVFSAASTSSHSVTVTFDGTPNPAQAMTLAYYSIPGLTLSGTPSLNGNTVTLQTSPQSATTFTVTVSNVTRTPDNEPLTSATASFTGRAPFNVMSAASVTSHSISVTFDAPPNAGPATTLTNYSVSGLTLSGVSLSGSTVTLTTSAQMATTYTVVVSSNVTRLGDNEPLTVASASFMGRTPFNVSGANSISNVTMTVTFNGTPNTAEATTLGNYSVPGLTLSGTPTLTGNTVTITTSSQSSTTTYTVTVSNVTRTDTEPLTIATASFMGKTGFNVSSAASVNTTTMSVTYDAAPNQTQALTLANYAVSGLTLSGTPTIAGNTVTITTSAQAGQTYTVVVSNVTRNSDASPLSNNSSSFTHTTFNVANATSVTSHSMSVTFDAPPNAAQATTLAYYSVPGLTLSGTPTLSGSTVTITTSPQTGATYTVSVVNVTRASDGTVLSNNTAMFTGRSPFDVASAASTSSGSMTVTYTDPPNTGQATTLANYAVSGGLTLYGTPVLSGNTVTINTSRQANVNYTVTVTGVIRSSDSEGLTTNTAMFTGTAESTPTVTNVAVQSTNPNNGTTFYNTGTATVIITGTDFTGTTCPGGVTLDDQDGMGNTIKTAATSCTVNSGTQITATFPAGIRTNGTLGWNVLVTNGAGLTNTTSAVKAIVKAGLLVSEIYPASPGGTGFAHQFFELYNPTANAINVNNLGMVVHVRDKNGNDAVLTLSFLSGNNHSILVSHGFMLMCSQDSMSGDSWYSHRDATYNDQTIGQLLSTSGSVYLSLSNTAQAKVIDKVGWGSQPSEGVEGQGAPQINSGNSIERKPGPPGGNATDTDNNNGDFNAPNTTISPAGTGDPAQP